MNRIVLMVATVVVPIAVQAQTIYKCESGGKVTYSSTACEGTEVKKINPQGGPTAEDQARARQRYQREAAALQASEAQRIQTSKQPTTAKKVEGPSTARNDTYANEKRIVGAPDGWDDKTNGQIQAESRAKAGHAVPRTGAKWEDERVLTHSRSGWSQPTRAQVVEQEGMKARERAAASTANSGAEHNKGSQSLEVPHTNSARAEIPKPQPSRLTNCDSGGCWDDVGNRYTRAAGTTSFRSDGKICQTVGTVVRCN